MTRKKFIRFPIRRILVGLISASFAVALFYVPWEEFLQALRSANPYWLAIAVLANLSIYPLWLVQWQQLAPPTTRPSNRVMFEIMALSSLANSALPSAAGLASTVVLLITRGKMTTATATAFMAVDQLLVGIAKLALLILALILAPMPMAATQSAIAFATLMVVFLIALFALAHLTEWTRTIAEKTSGLVAKGLVTLTKLSEGLDVLRHPGRASATILLAIAKKATAILAALAIQFACGIEFSLVSGILVVAAVSVATALPIVPGSFGIYTATVFVAYEFLGVPTGIALTAGLLQHLVEILPPLIVGYGTFFTSKSFPPVTLDRTKV